ncbi:hypothetical protein NW754_009566 [Fusarium falciforme]|nr:hypothetical protein NW754_009566 [Fusarium falciforme]
MDPERRLPPAWNQWSWSRQPPRQSQGPNDCLDTDKHALWPRLSACEPDPALSEEALSIATESLRFAQSELKHWFLAGVAGTQGDLEVEHRHLCAARYAGTLRLQHANQAIIVLKEARKNEPQGLVIDSPIWGMLLKVGPEWERAYDEEAEEDRRL